MHNLINLQENERVEFILRRHWIVFVLNLLVPLVLVLAYGLIAQVLIVAFPNITHAPYSNLGLLVTSAVMLFAWLLMLATWIDFYFDVWIVTNQRLVDIDQIGLFNRKTAELNYRHMQDVSVYQQGFLQTTFNYGSINIQSAGTVVKFNFDKAANPHEIEAKMLELYNSAMKRGGQADDVDVPSTAEAPTAPTTPAAPIPTAASVQPKTPPATPQTPPSQK